jgi:hypothetical protein
VATRVRYCVGDVGHAGAAQYALRTLLEMVVPTNCLVPETGTGERCDDEILVTYSVDGKHTGYSVHVFASGFFDGHYGTINAMPERPVVRIAGIPALYRDKLGPDTRFYSVNDNESGGRIDCHVDIVAGSFFMLSRYEETMIQTVDVFERFPAESSIAYQDGFLQEPVVNEYAEQLLEMLRTAGFTGERRKWWGTAPWAIALTHDVDQLHRFPHGRPPALAVARSLTGKAPVGAPQLKRLLGDYVQTVACRKTDEYNCLKEMATWESSVGVCAGYYFLGDSSAGRYGADYNVDATDAVSKMKTIASLGHEIGFHAGFWAYRDAERFHEELSRLQTAGFTVTGGRQHYLRWKTPATWRLWEQEGLSYDATLGYSKVAGFRCGTCLPFHTYDVEKDKEMSLWEWPLMFMDTTYISSWPEGTKVLDRLSRECQHYGGALVLLWHNRNWSSLYAPAIRKYFQDMLQRSVTHGVVVSSIDGLARLADIARISQL